MKNKIILTLFLVTLIVSITQAQNTKKHNFCISASRMNVFYIGVDNPIEIAVSGMKDSDIRCTISSGAIFMHKKGSYSVRVKRMGETVITIYANGKILGRKTFRVKRLPSPVAFCGGVRNGAMSKSKILASRGITAKIEDFIFDVHYEIVSFDISANISGFNEVATSRSGKFSSKQKSIILKIKKGSRIIIDNIKAKGPDGTIRKLNAIVIKVKYE